MFISCYVEVLYLCSSGLRLLFALRNEMKPFPCTLLLSHQSVDTLLYYWLCFLISKPRTRIESELIFERKTV